ncbi:hypothetical protein T10_9332 [Trichinella papuae]|uniref:Uncharacterized protein n=1 Tax=Trichinella papuae TaxID=268474 RepID=A0A0V1MJ02_9BILA|nr:hypothetical protein T10_9332 [Trichinella papuae]
MFLYKDIVQKPIVQTSVRFRIKQIQFKLIPDLLVQFEIVATLPICTLLTMAPSLLFVLTFVLLSIFSFILYGILNGKR